MKRWLICILAVLLVLAGCDGNPVPETTQSVPPHTTEATQQTEPPPSFYMPDTLLEKQSQGAVQVFGSGAETILTYAFMGEDPVAFYFAEDALRVTRFRADTGLILAEGLLPDAVDLWMGLGVGKDTLICRDMEENLLRFYDGQFRQLRTLPLPEDITEALVFTQDLSTAYYGQNGALRALDLHTGISRLVMQREDEGIYPTTLLFGDSVLYCYITGVYDSFEGFFSTKDGRMLAREKGFLGMETQGDFYVAQCSDGPMTEVLLGTRGGEVRSFRASDEFGAVELLERSGRLVEQLSLEDGAGIQLYDREKGFCLAKLFLKDLYWAGSFQEDAQGKIWFLTTDPEQDRDVLCRWDPSQAENGDTSVRIGPRYTLENPNVEGMAQCEARAQKLEQEYGVDICFYPPAEEPYDYAFTPEHQVCLIEAGLDELEKAMEKFPEGFFRTAASVTESGVFTVSLVRGITGTEYNTLPDAGGLQYWIDGNAYIALISGYTVEGNFYHELCHALDTYVVANSIHYDFWEDNNPEAFVYDYSYTDYDIHWNSVWLEEETRAFINAYSMTYPHEDRAVVFEYAIMEDNEMYFATETMQAKLRQLCLGIRQAFGWKKYEGTFLWEQYLHESLAYVKKK